MDFLLYQTKIIREADFNPQALVLKDLLTITYSLWFAHGEIPFLYKHLESIQLCLAELNIAGDKINFTETERLLHRLLNKNKAFLGGWIHLKLFLSPTDVFLVATVEAHPERQLPLNDQGAMAIVSKVPVCSTLQLPAYQPLHQIRNLIEHFSNFNSRNNLSILCNHNGVVTQTQDSNLFALKKDILYTPALDTGCFEDYLRNPIIASAKMVGLKIQETDSLKPAELESMDELFAASEKRGVIWILGLNNKRYIRKTTALIWETLDKVLWPRRLA